jgi:hypothetical protein
MPMKNMPMKNPPHLAALCCASVSSFGFDHHGSRRRAGRHPHHAVGTGEREARDFSRNGGAPVQGLRGQRRNLAYAAGPLRASPGQGGPHQTQAVAICLRGRPPAIPRRSAKGAAVPGNHTMFISELAEEDRKSIEKLLEVLPMMFRQCEHYLQDYRAGKQNMAKLFGVLSKRGR